MSDELDLRILGGTIVTSVGTRRAGVGILGGRIAAIAPEGDLPRSRRELDVSGALILPGGIDAHMHYDRDGRVVDDILSATTSAAAGGITTVIHHLLWEPNRTLVSVFEDAVAEIALRSVTDVAFHTYLRANDFEALAEVPGLVSRGVSSFKMNLAYKSRGMMCTDEFLIAAMDVIARAGGMALIHAESGEAIDYLERAATDQGRTRVIDYAATRPDYLEAEAIGRVAAFGAATRCPVYIVHLSSRAGLERLVEERRRGRDLAAETCPHYLALTEHEYLRQGQLAKTAPPLRQQSDCDALWNALATGDLSIVASDHAPFSSEKKQAAPTIFDCPFGTPNVETLLPIVLDGSHRRGYGPELAALVTSEGPARMFGLYPRKGSISVGADADLVVVDRDKRVKIRPGILHSRADYTPFDGVEVMGWPVVTIASGEVIVEDGHLVGTAGRGRYLPRPDVGGRLSDLMPQRVPLT